VIGLTIEALRVGDVAEITRVAVGGDIAQFADAVGDHNPIHADRAFAATTRFKEPIAPGIWTAGLISAVIGTRLPGPGAIYLSQDLRFLKPVYAGDVISARVEVLEILREKNRVRLRTGCRNQHGEDVVTGEAMVMPSLHGIAYSQVPSRAGLWAFWALQPWAWAAQGAALAGMLGLTALALGRRGSDSRDGVGLAPGGAVRPAP
jgi:3-hydroxybutyryl-CoA dehydratase